jgi:hypothetical protein
MPDRPLVLVPAALAPPGASVARHLLASGRYRVRALVPDPLAAPARRLAAAGAEVVRGRAEDRPSLRAALAGCYGVFASVEAAPGAAPSPGIALVHTVAGAEVEHLLLAGAPGSVAEEEAARLELPTTLLRPALPFECVVGWQAAGALSACDDAPVAAFALADLGGVVLGLLDRPGEHLGRRIAVVADLRPPREYAALLAAAAGGGTGGATPPDLEAIEGTPPTESVAAVVDRRCPPEGGRAAQIALCRRLYPGLRGFAEWVRPPAEGS